MDAYLAEVIGHRPRSFGVQDDTGTAKLNMCPGWHVVLFVIAA